MSDSAGDRIAELARLYLGGRHGELYDKAVSLVGELAVSGGRLVSPVGERHADLGGFWELAPVWARALELALRGDTTGLTEFLSRAPSSTGYLESRRRDVKLNLGRVQTLRGSGADQLRVAEERRSLSSLAHAGGVAREELEARVTLAQALALWLLSVEATGVDLTPHADCLFPDDYIPAPKVDVKEPVAVGEAVSRSYVDDLRTSLTLVQEKLCRTQGELRESQAALKDALQAQVNASKAEKPPMHDVRFGLPLPADCAAHSGPECGWLVTWHEDGARKTAILAAQWDRDYWSRKMATWVPLLRGLPCTWPVGGEPLPPYHVQHRAVIDGLRGALDVARADGGVLARQRDEARECVDALVRERGDARDEVCVLRKSVDALRARAERAEAEAERAVQEREAFSLRASAAERQRDEARQERDAALARPTYEVRETAPTQAELDAHASAGGAWLVAWTGPDAASATLEDSRIPSSWRHPPDWWIALGADRLPCAWPVVAAEVPS